MPGSVVWKWKVDAYRHATGSSMSKSSPREAFAEWCAPLPRNSVECAFRRHGAIYLTTVGYGIGAIYGRDIRRVKDVFWKDELGLAQAIWVLEVENFGPFLVECDVEGRSLWSSRQGCVSKEVKVLLPSIAHSDG